MSDWPIRIGHQAVCNRMEPTHPRNPMRAEFEVILGAALVSAGLSYAWWVKLRVWMLRQDLFRIRDEMWDAMRAKGLLDDPAHREARDSINTMIRVASSLSFFSILKLIESGLHAFRKISSDEELPLEVRIARTEAFIRISQYLLYDTLTGLAILCVAYMFGHVALLKSLTDTRVKRIFDSREIKALDRVLSGSGGGLVSGV